MSGAWLQFLAGGLTIGAIYALVALGFSIIFNASHVLNFAQGEFVMIGGMSAVSFIGMGLPMPLALLCAVAVTGVVGLLLEWLAVGRARRFDVVTLIIITIGASIFLRGLAQLVWDKSIHALPPLSGDAPISILGATIVPQSLWVIGVTVVVVAALTWFFNRTLLGKAMLATSYNRFAAQLVGIEVRKVLFASFGLAAALGAVAGVLIAPITFTSYDAGIMLGLKGFAAAMLGGLGSFPGAIIGGVLLGLLESLGAGYLSSAYKDVIAFVIILAVLFVRPDGILGAVKSERV
ncbi:MAG: branched-chain amino acid ABC transporter permease [Lautropia sp.]|jgi:branched-chain amino acid transport system permease protein|nr:MAG: branched-chain amino acid ABC transporter permease [Pseudomonadota bacterium]MBC6958929.1 branched-chain amino acid ABC transporter permease [Lautropia sp.]MCL4701077.1 branched-chain amino acid ABC transporter permease [Burkholderiaceae bacterium]MCZ2414334.1 branched-chain amino acid ABC transporter permease [Burkholderiales bacterium]MDL1908666.1 branched-chain amino acid ABC transporter permease [Betaproteobacteria bacterium PRO1]